MDLKKNTTMNNLLILSAAIEVGAEMTLGVGHRE
jgi:hypothetical protein